MRDTYSEYFPNTLKALALIFLQILGTAIVVVACTPLLKRVYPDSFLQILARDAVH